MLQMLIEAKNEADGLKGMPSSRKPSSFEDAQPIPEMKGHKLKQNETPPPQQKDTSSSRTLTYNQMIEYGCIRLELISNLGLEKHWKVKIKAIAEIEEIINEQDNFKMLMPHIVGFVNFLTKLTRDTNNNVVVAALKLMNKVF
jgi:hypothetical protein